MNKTMQHYKKGVKKQSSNLEKSVVLDDRFCANYQEFLDDVFSGNTRQQQINNDAEQFLKELESYDEENRDVIQHYEDRQQDMKMELQHYIDHLKDKKYKGQKNIEEFEHNLKQGNVFNQKSFQNIQLSDLMDIPKRNPVHQEQWFEIFKQQQFLELKNTLEEIAVKLYRARMTDELKENRQQLDEEITKLIEEIEYDPMENKQKLFKLEKLVMELQQYDDIIPQIMADLMNKASEFSQQLLILCTELKGKCNQQLENIEKHSFYNSKSFQYEYKNLRSQEPSKLRVSRFGFNFNNNDLLSLQVGAPIQENIVLFFVEFFRERNRQQNLQELQDILVLPSNFFELLIPPGGVLDYNNMSYSNVKALTAENKGDKNTIFDKYKRILFNVLLSGNNFLLVEIKTHPDPEILIYDSNYNISARFHEKIVRCIKAYIIEELKDKTNMLEGECIQYARQFIPKGVNCPQVKDSYSGGLYFIKNLEMCAKGSHVTPYSYNTKEIDEYRLVLFSSMLRIGVNEDRPIVYDSVL